MGDDFMNLQEALQAENARLREQAACAEQRTNALSVELSSARQELQRAHEEKARAEEDRRAAQRLLQTIIDTLDPILIGWKDRASVYLGCNRPAATYAGIEAPEDMVGKTDYDLRWTQEDADSFRAVDRQVMDSSTPVYQIIALQHGAGGRQTWLKINKMPLTEGAGNVTGILFTIEDITAQKQQEQELKAERSLMGAVLNNDGFLIVVLDRQGRIVRFNTGCEKMTGYSQDELTGKYFWDYLLVEEELEPVKSVFNSLNAGLFPSSFENFWVTKGREKRLIAWRNTALLDGDGEVEYLVGTGLDITELRRAEAERASLQAQVIEAQRSALRELSTPLIPIADNVVAMPLIGAIDEQRADQLMDVLLKGVSTHRAETVILDITGVHVVDTQIANVFVQAARAVRLLGAEVMLTGVQPRLAETLVRMGVDLRGIRTLGSLQAGIAAALKKP